jgi:hypothetical protein
MPRIAGFSTPSYRHHKASAQAVVTIEGRDFYLGRYGDKQSRIEYDRLIGEWLANGRRMARTVGCDLTINELLLDYLQFAAGLFEHGRRKAARRRHGRRAGTGTVRADRSVEDGGRVVEEESAELG